MKAPRLPFSRLLPLFALLAALQGCSRSDKPVDGAAVFRQCASCHQTGVNARGGFGPQLNGLFGRPAGSTADFAYSPAMKASGIVWNEQTLARFLADPDKAVPGTRMRFWGISDKREMQALLAYLRSFQDAR